MQEIATKKGQKSLAYRFPEIAKEWHPNKNGLLTPDKINWSSRRKVWWLGKCGHEWLMSVGDRTVTFTRKDGRIRKQYNCPFCSNKRVGKGINDLQTRFPQIAEEWHTVKNGDLLPDSIMAGSNKYVWWHGKCGHDWKARPHDRCFRNRNCPICYAAKRSPAVECIETDEVFASGLLAARKLGLKSASTIYKCCRGEIKTAYGYHWKYKSND